MWLPLLLLASIATATQGSVQKPPNLKLVLARAGDYVRAQAEALPHLVAEEHRIQTRVSFVMLTRLHGGHLSAVTKQKEARETLADFAWVTVPGVPEAIGVREVREVDDEAVDGGGRLKQILRGTLPGSFSDVRTILDESAAYNLAPGSRNVNLPTFVLFLLHPDFQERFKWQREGSGNEPVWTVRFKERERPTVVRDDAGRSVFSEGRVWVDAATGTVIRTELAMKVESGVNYRMAVTFTPHPALGLTLPDVMEESFQTPEAIVEGRSTYTNYRRFETGARVIQ